LNQRHFIQWNKCANLSGWKWFVLSYDETLKLSIDTYGGSTQLPKILR
jgi:hypothetical protein